MAAGSNPICDRFGFQASLHHSPDRRRLDGGGRRRVPEPRRTLGRITVTLYLIPIWITVTLYLIPICD